MYIKRIVQKLNSETEEEVIRGNFIRRMSETDIQREMLRKTVESYRALTIDINMEMGQQNLLNISSATQTKSIACEINSDFRTTNRQKDFGQIFS